MTNVLDFQPVYPRHDLLVAIGQVEMAIDRLQETADDDQRAMKPVLESRKHSLMSALQRLAA